MFCVLVARTASALSTVTEQLKQWLGCLWVHKLKIVVFPKAEFPKVIKFGFTRSIMTTKGFVGISSVFLGLGT